MRRKYCVLLPAAGRRTQFFLLIFTEPGRSLFAEPCRPQGAGCYFRTLNFTRPTLLLSTETCNPPPSSSLILNGVGPGGSPRAPVLPCLSARIVADYDFGRSSAKWDGRARAGGADSPDRLLSELRGEGRSATDKRAHKFCHQGHPIQTASWCHPFHSGAEFLNRMGGVPPTRLLHGNRPLSLPTLVPFKLI